MVEAKCIKCGGTATGDSFEQARQRINHAVGLSRGIKCGDNYNHVTEIKPKEIIPKNIPKIEPPTTETSTPLTSHEKPKEKKKTKKSSDN